MMGPRKRTSWGRRSATSRSSSKTFCVTKKLQAQLRNAQKKKQRLTKRTRMLSDNDLLDIMRMRAAQSSKEKVDDDKTAKASQAESPGAAATLGTHLAAGEEPAAEASEGNAEQLPDSPA